MEVAKRWPFRGAVPHRVVLKVGSNVLALKEGGLNAARIGALVDSVAAIKKLGCEVILVSSGAVAAGRGILGLTRRPTEIPELQAVAAIGQGALMEAYSGQFRRHGLIVAQMLLNRGDMDDRRRYLNARHALHSLLQKNVVPIINENDTVTIDELRFGDNDMLSAMVAAKMEANLLLIMSNVPGLMTGNPSCDPEARVIPVVERVTAETDALVHAEGSSLGVGGMATKLSAARHATQFGIATVIVNGTEDGVLERVMTGEFEGTLFLPTSPRRAGDGRRHWLVNNRPLGDLRIDAGAVAALIERGRSLLPIGIVEATGDFDKGDVVRIVSPEGAALAHGIVNYDRVTVDRIRGRRRPEILEMLGGTAYEEVVHRNNLVLLNEGMIIRDEG